MNVSNSLRIEKLEDRTPLVGDIDTAIAPGLGSRTASYSLGDTPTDNPHILVSGSIAGTPYTVKAPLAGGRLIGDAPIVPAEFADAVFAANGYSERGIDTTGRQQKVNFIPGATSAGDIALFNPNGGLEKSYPIMGEISILHETPFMHGLINETSGSQKLLLDGDRIFDIPETVKVEAILKALTGETMLTLAGTNTLTGKPTILNYNLDTGAFLQPVDIELAPGVTGSIKGITRAADASGVPVAIVEAYGLLPGNVPVVGSVSISTGAIEVFGPSNGGKVISEMGITVYQGEGDWLVYVGSRTASNLTGLLRGVPIPLSGILSDGGFGDTKVNDVTSVITDGFGRLYLVSDIEVDGFQMTSIISVFESAPLNNKQLPLDTDNDTTISPLDVLVIVNEINKSTSQGNNYSLATVGANNLTADDRFFPYLDADGDGTISPLDVLAVINFINQRGAGGEGEGVNYQQIVDQTGATQEREAELLIAPSLNYDFQNTIDDLNERRLKTNGALGRFQVLSLPRGFLTSANDNQTQSSMRAAADGLGNDQSVEQADVLSKVFSEISIDSEFLLDQQVAGRFDHALSDKVLSDLATSS